MSLQLMYTVNVFSVHTLKVLVKKDTIHGFCNLIDIACSTRDSEFRTYIVIHHSHFNLVSSLG